MFVFLEIYSKRSLLQLGRPTFRAMVRRSCLQSTVWKVVTTTCPLQQWSLATRIVLFDHKALKRPWLFERNMFSAMLFVEQSVPSQNAVTLSASALCAEARSTGERRILAVHLMLSDD